MMGTGPATIRAVRSRTAGIAWFTPDHDLQSHQL
jgi:hypothetical protein